MPEWINPPNALVIVSLALLFYASVIILAAALAWVIDGNPDE